VLQALDGHSVMNYTAPDQYSCSASFGQPVIAVTNIVCQPDDLHCPEVRLGQQAYINAMLSEEVIQFLLPAADTVSIPASQSQGFGPFSPCGPCCHIRLRIGLRH
jgi:hypothetical protein